MFACDFLQYHTGLKEVHINRRSAQFITILWSWVGNLNDICQFYLMYCSVVWSLNTSSYGGIIWTAPLQFPKVQKEENMPTLSNKLELLLYLIPPHCNNLYSHTITTIPPTRNFTGATQNSFDLTPWLGVICIFFSQALETHLAPGLLKYFCQQLVCLSLLNFTIWSSYPGVIVGASLIIDAHLWLIG